MVNEIEHAYLWHMPTVEQRTVAAVAQRNARRQLAQATRYVSALGAILLEKLGLALGTRPCASDFAFPAQ